MIFGSPGNITVNQWCSGRGVRGGSQRTGEELEDGAVVLRLFLRVPGTALHLRRRGAYAALSSPMNNL